MNEKCQKYESLFIFATEDELQEHIKNCPDCSEEEMQMQNVSKLINEVKPYYLNRKKVSFIKFSQIAAGIFVIILAYFVIDLSYVNNSFNNQNLSYNPTDSVIYEMGLPVDEYGLLTVE